MKKAFLITTMVLLVTLVSAQERIKEAGLSFYSLNGFGLNYKVGTPVSLWRLNSMYTSGYNLRETNGSIQTDRKRFGVQFRAGREFRKSIADDLEFRYGVDLSFSYDRSKFDSKNTDTDARLSLEKRTEFAPGIDAVLGLNYLIREKIVIGAELLPGFSYRSAKTENLNVFNNETYEVKNSGFNFDISSSSVLLVIAYRFKAL